MSESQASPKQKTGGHARLLLRPELQLICAIGMITMIGGAAVAPVLPVIQKSLNVATENIGLMMTLFALPAIVAIPVTGILADRFGRRPVFVPLLFLYGLAGGLSFFAPDFETLLFMRFLAGAGAGALASLSLTLTGDFFKGNERAAALGFRIATGQIANGLAPVATGMLSIFGWQYPFLIFFLAIPVGFLALAILEAGERQTENTLRQYLATVWRGLSNRRTASLLSISPTLMVINQGFILVFIPVLMATDFGASPTVIGMIFAVRVVFGVIGASSIGWVTSRVREESLIIACLLTLTLGIALVPFANSIIQLFPAIILIGISTGIVFPAFQSLLLGEATEKTRGGVMAANGMTNRFGQTVGPVLSGGLYVIGGIELVFFGGALLIFMMTLFLGVTFYRHHR